MENKLNIIFKEGAAFFSHEAGITCTPTQIVLDFKSITPRLDQRSDEAIPLIVEHNVILLELFTATQLSDMLISSLKNYETQFGKIEKPAAMITAEKIAAKFTAVPKINPSYFG